MQVEVMEYGPLVYQHKDDVQFEFEISSVGRRSQSWRNTPPIQSRMYAILDNLKEAPVVDAFDACFDLLGVRSWLLNLNRVPA